MILLTTDYYELNNFLGLQTIFFWRIYFLWQILRSKMKFMFCWEKIKARAKFLTERTLSEKRKLSNRFRWQSLQCQKTVANRWKTKEYKTQKNQKWKNGTRISNLWSFGNYFFYVLHVLKCYFFLNILVSTKVLNRSKILESNRDADRFWVRTGTAPFFVTVGDQPDSAYLWAQVQKRVFFKRAV